MANVRSSDFRLEADDDISRLEIIIERQPTSRHPGRIRLGWETSIGFTVAGVLRGESGEDVSGWRFGFIQIKHTTLEWQAYRGAEFNDGSVLSRLHTNDVRPELICRDSYADGAIFYGEPSQSTQCDVGTDRSLELSRGASLSSNGNLDIILSMSDSPSRWYPLIVSNGRFSPPKDNFLYSLESRAAFIVLFAAQAPDDTWKILKHIYWNVHWEARLQFEQPRALRIRSRTMQVNVQRQARSGMPDDSRFRSKVTDPQLRRCNPIAQNAYDNPQRFRYAPTWQHWHVGR